jgi:hypothetical protein
VPNRWAPVVAVLLAGAALVASAPPAAAAPVRDITRFACREDLQTEFTDVAGTTHETAIECAVHYELTGGTSPTTYSPDTSVSRGQMATFLMRLLGLIDLRPGDFPPAGFDDTVGSPHEAAIDAAVFLGVAQGTSATTFSPTAPVSRAQMATFLFRVIGVLGYLPAAPGEDAFDDDDGNQHEGAIQAMADHGIAGGTAPRVYDPSGSVGRGAMAAFLVRVIDAGIEQGAYVPFITSEAFVAMVGEDASATAYVVTTDVPGVLCIGVESDDLGALSSVEVRQGGTAVATVPAPGAAGSPVRCIADADGVSADVLADPSAFTVRVVGAGGRTAEGPVGEADTEFVADLQDVEVVPGPGDPAAFGFVFAFTTTVPDVLCATTLAFAEEPVTGAHVHRAPPHQNGPEVLALDPLDGDEMEAGDALGFTCVTTELATELEADPTQFYVDVHTTAFPGGAVRGQLETAFPVDGIGYGNLAQNSTRLNR